MNQAAVLVSAIAVVDTPGSAGRALESFQRQNWLHRELILVNTNGSEVAGSIRPAKGENPVEAGVRAARGQVCVVWSPDCWFHEDVLGLHARLTVPRFKVELRDKPDTGPVSYSFFRRAYHLLDCAKLRRVSGLNIVGHPDASLPKPGNLSLIAVLLGRFGDITNLLPVLRDLHDRGEDVWLAVSWEFRDLLDGVSYVKALPLPLDLQDINEALVLLRKKFKRVLNCQIWGRNFFQVKQCPAFNQESWRMAGYGARFHDQSLPLIFDRRDAAREAALRARVFKTSRPKIVVNLTSGFSSPFPAGPAVLARFQEALPDYEVVDIGRLACLYPFDVLGLLDDAVIIVTIDTLTLHLALASRTPLICIVRERGWGGTTPRYNCAAKLAYDDVARDPELLVIEATRVLESL